MEVDNVDVECNRNSAAVFCCFDGIVIFDAKYDTSSSSDDAQSDSKSDSISDSNSDDSGSDSESNSMDCGEYVTRWSLLLLIGNAVSLCFSLFSQREVEIEELFIGIAIIGIIGRCCGCCCFCFYFCCSCCSLFC